MLFTRDEWPSGKNLAYSPAVWRKMFAALPSAHFGLNYDPSHMIWQFMDHLAPIARVQGPPVPHPRQGHRHQPPEAERVGDPGAGLADAGDPGPRRSGLGRILRRAADQPATTGPSASRWKTTRSARHSTAGSGRCANRVARWRRTSSRGDRSDQPQRHRGHGAGATRALDWRRRRSGRSARGEAPRRQESVRVTTDSCLPGVIAPRMTGRFAAGASRVPVDRANSVPRPLRALRASVATSAPCSLCLCGQDSACDTPTTSSRR